MAHSRRGIVRQTANVIVAIVVGDADHLWLGNNGGCRATRQDRLARPVDDRLAVDAVHRQCLYLVATTVIQIRRH